MPKHPNPNPGSRPVAPSGARSTTRHPIDPLLAKRLEQLNTRRPGSPLPPPSTQEAARAQAARARSKPVGRRAKPARSAKVASLALSVVTTAGLAALFADHSSSTDSVILTGGTVAAGTGTGTAATTATTTVATTVAPNDVAPNDVAPTTVAPTTVAPNGVAGSGTIIDGTYVGGASQNRWGTVQVQAVYSGGQLVDVQILSYPDGDGRSIRINQRSLPTLIDESISAQSANINGVSGATYTSNSYVASLQSAIDAAKSASGIAG